uniref:Uncharacterized protein n=1 Tax=Arundo donax TaxID=35708 RepID=A0A0A9CN74_ARUDO
MLCWNFRPVSQEPNMQCLCGKNTEMVNQIKVRYLPFTVGACTWRKGVLVKSFLFKQKLFAQCLQRVPCVLSISVKSLRFRAS